MRLSPRTHESVALLLACSLQAPALATGPRNGVEMPHGTNLVTALSPGLVPYSDEATLTGNCEFNSTTLKKLVNKNVVLLPGSSGNTLKFYKGRVLVFCQNPIKLVIPDATIDLARGTAVYVYSTGESAAIINLHDRHRNDVRVQVQHEPLSLPCGRELLITRYGTLSFDEARLLPGIWYRSVMQQQVTPEIKVFLTQFSTISAVAILPAVHELVQHNSDARAKIFKTFAAVCQVSRDPQPFRPNMAKPPIAVQARSRNSREQ